MAEFQEKIDEFTIIRKIGSGFSADVYLASLNDTKYALKVFKMEAIQFAETEYKNARKLYHDNIIGYQEYRRRAKHITAEDENICNVLIMEYAEKGEIYDLVDTCKGLNEQIARTYFHMLIEGLQHIHSCGISHLDIKAQNLLLDAELTLKIADFGFSSSSSELIDKKVGTEGYMAPEIEKDGVFVGQQADIFAAGVCLFILTTGFLPFRAAKNEDIYYKTLNSNPKKFWGSYSFKKLSQNFKDLIEKMLSKNPESRPSISQIKQHPWYCEDILLTKDLQAAVAKLQASQ